MLNKVLRLERSLAVLDLETTGLDPEKDRIVQIALTIHYVNRDPIAWSSLINPGIPILNTKNHSICDADVVDKPTFERVAPALAPKLLNVDFCGYNVDFDIRFIRAGFKRHNVDWPWSGFVIDPLHIYRMRHGHTLTNAYKRYVDPAGFQGAHDAGNDVRATEQVLVAQLNEYQDLPRTVKDLSSFCFPHPENAVDKAGKFVWVGKDCAFNFGAKHRGKLLKDPSVRSYLRWMSTADFADDVMEIVVNALQGIYPEKDE